MLQIYKNHFNSSFKILKLYLSSSCTVFACIKIIGFILLYFGNLLNETGSPCTMQHFTSLLKLNAIFLSFTECMSEDMILI